MKRIYANYAEQALQKVENQLIQSESFDQSLIPFPCIYVLYSKTGDVQNSNMREDEISHAKEYLSGKFNTLNGEYSLFNAVMGAAL
ncbi:hypothetical protein [Marinisporobacter balticus]|nr:hypothetical protein [Marinisporobacter balticus]